MKITYTIVVIAVIALLGVAVGWNSKPVVEQLSSVQTASEYNHTNIIATTSKAFLFKSEPGTLGSVIINVLGTGNVVFYDATSTIPAQRTITATTSLPIVGVIAASQAAGTYTYDVNFYNGLIAVFDGTIGTSTITWR